MTAKHLEGKVAIVTGGSRGIGRAIAERFASEGAQVVINYARDAAAATAAIEAIRAGGGDAVAIRADVAKPSEARALVGAAIEAFGRVDTLVNNAGVHIAKPIAETTEDDWDLTMAINLKAPYVLSKEVAPGMIRQGGGSIVNMSSNSGLYHPSAMRFTEYVVSKAGLNGLTKAMALAYGPHIRVNAICPGWIRTDMLEDIDAEIHDRILAETALARWGTPGDIASSAVFLASDEASFITGELLLVAGGRGMH